LNPLRGPNVTSTYPLASSQEVEYSREFKEYGARGSNVINGQTNSSTANLFNNFNTNTNSPLRPPPSHTQAMLNEEDFSPERSVHSQHDNNSHPSHKSRRDTGSAAAAPSSEKEHTGGSWNQKSSPRDKPHSDRPNAENATPVDIHIKIADKDGYHAGNARATPNAAGPSQTPPKEAAHTTCCAKCIIM